jgi:hypothetical protein
MTLIGAILLVLATLVFLACIWFNKPKSIGTIICQKDDSFVIELKDEEALDNLRISRQVTFDVHIER